MGQRRRRRRGAAMTETTSNPGEQPLSVEHMLAQEADAIRGGTSRMAASLAPELIAHHARTERIRESADERDGQDRPKAQVDQRKAFYRSLNKLNRAALCLSGGGIRSATFCLGIIQALAARDVAPLQARPEDPQPAENTAITPHNSLLGRFHYLSTVSGGGYIGSWLSSWRHRDTFTNILNNLIGRPSGPDVEPPEISWLRAYSNYLTPRTGIGSADAWAAAAIIVRNLVLNWLIIIPVVCLVLLALKIIATGSVWIAHGKNDDDLVLGVLLAGVVFLIGSQAFTTHNRPARRPPQPEAASSDQPGNVSQKLFVWCDLLWSVLSAIAITIFLSSHYFWQHFLQQGTADWPAFGFAKALSPSPKIEPIVAAACAGLAIYALGWIFGFRPRLGARDFIGGLWDFVAWALSGLVYGALVGLGAVLFALLGPYPADDTNRLCLLLAIILGVPWVLTAQLTADNIFGGLVSYEAMSDSDREWLGRAAGWVAAITIAWAVVAFLVFAGGNFVQTAESWAEKGIAAAGGVIGVISGIATALLGKSDKTPATSSSDEQMNFTAKAYDIGLALAGPIFAAVLIIALSIALDELLLRTPLVEQLQPAKNAAVAIGFGSILIWLSIGLGIAAAIAGAASWFVNINRFSLHALYRNRLTRAYLGASRQQRHPDLFTGFDIKDNVRMHQLWPPMSDPGHLFHVVNIALNIVSAERLAWQERKAESFTASPRHCGSAYLGFRPSDEYGDSLTRRTTEHGIALGTAMAISGAAVSSNMGYHSSPSLALLLTLFNVRLGWWLGNPGPAGDKHKAYRREGPRFSVLPLLLEAFGQTTDDRPYVYLSDGGHFENLGLYEMVRRRCRMIVVIDAGCDPDFAFEDLGNAVRKIYIDLGVRIKFTGLERLRDRPKKCDPAPGEIPYCAIGTIDYASADGEEAGCENGSVIYIKPAYHGTEGAAIRSYANAHESFPHETTVDQWFTESQFESYRALGLDIASHCLGNPDVQGILHQFLRHAV